MGRMADSFVRPPAPTGRRSAHPDTSFGGPMVAHGGAPGPDATGTTGVPRTPATVPADDVTSLQRRRQGWPAVRSAEELPAVRSAAAAADRGGSAPVGDDPVAQTRLRGVPSPG